MPTLAGGAVRLFARFGGECEHGTRGSRRAARCGGGVAAIGCGVVGACTRWGLLGGVVDFSGRVEVAVGGGGGEEVGAVDGVLVGVGAEGVVELEADLLVGGVEVVGGDGGAGVAADAAGGDGAFEGGAGGGVVGEAGDGAGGAGVAGLAEGEGADVGDDAGGVDVVDEGLEAVGVGLGGGGEGDSRVAADAGDEREGDGGEEDEAGGDGGRGAWGLHGSRVPHSGQRVGVARQS